MRTAKILAALAAAATLAACSTTSPVEQRLADYWTDLGTGGQQTLCLGLAVEGEQWVADQLPDEYAGESVAFFVEHCADVELPSPESLGFGIPA